MVFEVIIIDRKIIPPFIFLDGLRLNTEAYIKFLAGNALAQVFEKSATEPKPKPNLDAKALLT